MNVVLRICAWRHKPIVAMTCFRAAIVIAQIIPAFQTVTAISATFVWFTSHSITGFKIQHPFSDRYDLACPFMTGDKGVGWGPNASQFTSEDFRITAADGYSPHST